MSLGLRAISLISSDEQIRNRIRTLGESFILQKFPGRLSIIWNNRLHQFIEFGISRCWQTVRASARENRTTGNHVSSLSGFVIFCKPLTRAAETRTTSLPVPPLRDEPKDVNVFTIRRPGGNTGASPWIGMDWYGAEIASSRFQHGLPHSRARGSCSGPPASRALRCRRTERIGRLISFSSRCRGPDIDRSVSPTARRRAEDPKLKESDGKAETEEIEAHFYAIFLSTFQYTA
jgi:hypothetical protein